MNIHVLWFRGDFRLRDNPTLAAALKGADTLLCVAVDDTQWRERQWSFQRRGPARLTAWQHATAALNDQLTSLGQRLHVITGQAGHVLPTFLNSLLVPNGDNTRSHVRVFTQAFHAPYEQDDLRALRATLSELAQTSGMCGVAAVVTVEEIDSGDLLDAEKLPFGKASTLHTLPPVFTAFRHQVERCDMPMRALLPAPLAMPGPPLGYESGEALPRAAPLQLSEQFDSPLEVSEAAGLKHLAWYFSDQKAHHYKSTRNGLMRSAATGSGYATKLSSWLALGCLSPVTVWHALKSFEADNGASNSSHWIGFELLWREHFRWLHKRHGASLYKAQGSVAQQSPPAQHKILARQSADFERWRTGQTDSPFVNAGMRELALTGYVSNRMRQVLASFWLYEYAGDWRLGAAWFEHTLLDYDVMSNTGNWLYIAGLGSDPKGGRRFDVAWQARTHDPQGVYTRRWSKEAL